MVGVRHSFNGWLRVFVVISLMLQGVIAATPSHAHEAPAAGTHFVPCPHGSDCTGDSGNPAPAHHCDASHGHTPSGLIASYSTAAIASQSTPLPALTALFSVYIAKLPSRPPLAFRG